MDSTCQKLSKSKNRGNNFMSLESKFSQKNLHQIELENSSEQKISFHLFPKCILRRSKWLKAIQLEKYIPPKTTAVCSAHFKEADYELNHPQRKLKKDAIPYLREAEIRLDVPIDPQNTTSVQENVNNEAEKNEVQIQEMDVTEVDVKAKEMDVTEVDVKAEEIDVTKEDDTCSYNHRMIHRSTSISPDRIMNSPTKCRIRKLYKNEITAMKRKLSVSRYKQKRIHKKLVFLKTVLKDLQKRNLLRIEDSDILQYLDAGTRELVQRNVMKQKNVPVTKTYTPNVRKFALSLHYYSPKAYNYVRHKFYNMLPHPKTLGKWYYSFNGEPGINTEAIESIKQRAHSVSYRLIGALMFDEMAIRQHVDYCKDRFVGYVQNDFVA